MIIDFNHAAIPNHPYPDDQRLPPIPTRLSLVKMFLELELFEPALLVLTGIMAFDDQEVEAWYLEGWCFVLMAEKAQENGGTFNELTWEQLARDARDCLETCKMVNIALRRALRTYSFSITFHSYMRTKSIQIHRCWSMSRSSLRSLNLRASNRHQKTTAMMARKMAAGKTWRAVARTRMLRCHRYLWRFLFDPPEKAIDTTASVA